MVRVLVIGYAPEAVDFTDPALPPTDPALPPGMNESIIAEGLRSDLKRMHEQGWEAQHLLVRAGDPLRERILDHLRTNAFDCIVIGAGMRLTTKHVLEFEEVVNAIREGAPNTPIAFNSSPSTSGEAAARRLPK